MSGTRDLAHRGRQLRVTRWHGDPSIAHLAPLRGRPSTLDVQRCVEELASEGFHAALTGALATHEQEPFLAAGFSVHERLHLLTRPVDDIPNHHPPPGVRLRRARRSDRGDVLAIDHEAFPDFWQLDRDGLGDALAATPSSRLRLATDRDRGPVGYAITGRAGSRGYLQRLAVAPSHQRAGLGSALVVDGLHWLRRWGAREVLVNTQEVNEGAVRLYLRLGFRLQPGGLAVLRRTVGRSS